MRALRREGGLLLLCGALIGGALLLAPSCASTDGGQGEDLAQPAGDGGAGDGGADPMGCFMGNPQTEPELLNRCTEAERIERPSRVPAELWDGKAPLPQPPL